MENKIQILSHARGGSTYLYEILFGAINHHHKGFFMINEPFNMTEENAPHLAEFERDELLQHRVDKVSKLPKVLMKNHIQHYEFLVADQRERINDDWYNIFLYRNDMFESTLSLAISQKTNQWTFYDNNSLTINSQEFAIALELQIKVREMLFACDMFKPNEIIQYEDLLLEDDKKSDYESLSLSKQIGPYHAGPKLATRSPDKGQRIANYRQLRDQYHKVVDNRSFQNFDLRYGRVTATRLDTL